MRLAALRTQRLLLSLLVVALLIVSLVLSFAARQLWSSRGETQTTLAEERAAFQARLREIESELVSTRSELKTAYASIDALVEKRIPGLRDLKLDQVIPVDQDYIREISFTPARGSDRTAYELKAVIENTSSVSVSPAATVLLFDKVGVEVGRSMLGGDSGGEVLTLRPGEIRSLFVVVELEPGHQASYFRLDSTGP